MFCQQFAIRPTTQRSTKGQIVRAIFFKLFKCLYLKMNVGGNEVYFLKFLWMSMSRGFGYFSFKSIPANVKIFLSLLNHMWYVDKIFEWIDEKIPECFYINLWISLKLKIKEFVFRKINGVVLEIKIHESVFEETLWIARPALVRVNHPRGSI